jgi:hypothetical protein
VVSVGCTGRKGKHLSSPKYFLFEWDATARSRATHTKWIQECREGADASISLFSSHRVVGMIKIMLDMAHDDDALGINDSTGLSANSASIVPFPTPLACAVVLR